MICKICGKEGNVLINIGLDVGFHLGDYGSGGYKKYKVEPVCIGVCSIHLCSDCKHKIEKKKYFNVNVMDKLKELIKGDLLKNMILEELK